MPTRRIQSLSLHADYACRHSGACCTAGWAIPVEPSRQATCGTALLVPSPTGACVHYDGDAHRCRVQRAHGESMLPLACHHFPRRALIDDRGVSVTLSHFCPTAASLLFRTDVELTIVDAPAAFPPGREYEGLDGRGQWPPLVRPGLLFDAAGYDEWERLVVATFAAAGSVEQALRTIAAAAEQVRGWRPENGEMHAWVAAAARPRRSAESFDRYGMFAAPRVYRDVIACVPEGLAPPDVLDNAEEVALHLVDPHWHEWCRVVAAYLAAKAFASWNAYQAHGLRTQVAELVAAQQVLRIESAKVCAARGAALDGDALLDAIRAADWLLVHLVDRDRFVRWLGQVEAG